MANTLEGDTGRGIAFPGGLYYLADFSTTRIKQPPAYRQPGSPCTSGHFGHIDIYDASEDQPQVTTDMAVCGAGIVLLGDREWNPYLFRRAARGSAS